MNVTYFSNQLLIAMPDLNDPNFSKTVTLICEHNENGALGIVINRPMELKLEELFDHLTLKPTNEQISDQAIYWGGPMQMEHGFVLHTPLGNWESTLKVNEELGLTASHDILVAIAQDRGPKQTLIALGYAGWGPGQLEQEIMANSWLTVASDLRILFDLPATCRWQAAAEKLGVDLSLLSGHAGHA